MKQETRFAVVTLVFAIVGLAVGPNTPIGEAIWGSAAEEAGAGPTGNELAFLIGVSIVQAIAFGFGVAFLAFGAGVVRQLGGSPGLATAAHLAISWSLISWVPHSAMHMTTGPDMSKLILTEYVFHVTLILGGAVLAWYFWSLSRLDTTTKVAGRAGSSIEA
ncbi:MAG: hypothetical protein HY556_09860 [Euryarchaeota archaeon]|nr:hypothetical protein [Euryarchaeota archaeon]